MNLDSSICFCGSMLDLQRIDKMINVDGIVDDMIISIDNNESCSSSVFSIYNCSIDQTTWVDIYKLKERILEKYPDMDVEVIYASTDSGSYIDVVSTDGNYDTSISDDPERVQEMCEHYGLEFYSTSIEPENDWDYEEDEDEEDYYGGFTD